MEKRIWEQIHNPDFKGIEFETFRTQAGLNSFTLTPRKWVEATAAKVSLEMGNSPQMVFAHYRELVKPKDAEVYWNINPAPKSGNVVAFEEAAA